ncbi:hypothetical protein [Microcystis phage Mel-JY01]
MEPKKFIEIIRAVIREEIKKSVNNIATPNAIRKIIREEFNSQMRAIISENTNKYKKSDIYERPSISNVLNSDNEKKSITNKKSIFSTQGNSKNLGILKILSEIENDPNYTPIDDYGGLHMHDDSDSDIIQESSTYKPINSKNSPAMQRVESALNRDYTQLMQVLQNKKDGKMNVKV